jgi:transposase
MENIDPNNIIVIDESGADLSMANDYARAEGGQRAKAPKPHISGTKYSIIGAITLSAIAAILYVENAVNGYIFHGFVKKLLLPHLKKGMYVVMDNVSFHKQKIIIELIESTGAKVVFLPPYSPDLSPIEKMWSKIKEILKKLKPRTKHEFYNAICNALDVVNSSDLDGWYEECGYATAA